MKFSRVYAIFLRQWYLVKGSPTRLIGMFIWLVLDIFMWGFINKYLGSFGEATLSFTTVILGAIILWEFTSQVQRGVMMSFMEDIWSSNFINYFASPLTMTEYVGGLVLTTIVSSAVGATIALALVRIAFGYSLFKIGLLLIPFILVLFIFAVAIGLLIASIIFRLGPSAEWLGWPIPMILSIFSGVFYPIAVLPAALQSIAHLIPASYVFESMRAILATGVFSPEIRSNLLVGGTLAVAYLLATFWLFVRVYKYNLRNGNLTRFNAEAL